MTLDVYSDTHKDIIILKYKTIVFFVTVELLFPIL